MGLDRDTTKFLLYAKRSGVDFSRTAMIGRQFFYLDTAALTNILRDFGYSLPSRDVERMLSGNGGYAEGLFQMLGAGDLSSFDATSYEGASHVHDFNLPIPREWCNRFSAVIDGGSLEHVFNFPVAIKNCMQMLEVGGHFLGMHPGNNWFGHGFYQFSPDLFFRVFSPQNGFEIAGMLVCERNTGNWFEVVDPLTINRRVGLINNHETYLLTLAKKVSDVPIFSTTPQQSDYVQLWSDASRPSAAVSDSGVSQARSRLRQAVPSVLKEAVRRYRANRLRLKPRFDDRCFKKVNIP